MIPLPPFEVPYTRFRLPSGSEDFLPMLGVQVGTANPVSFDALLDTGAAVNILPYSASLQLGLDRATQTLPIRLGGILASTTAFGVALHLQFGPFPPTLMVFAWIDNDQTPLILGRGNFFMEYDVCFFQTHGTFAVQTKRT